MVPVAYIPVGVTITMLVKLTEAITASYPDAYLSGEGVPEGMLFKVVLEHDTDT